MHFDIYWVFGIKLYRTHSLALPLFYLWKFNLNFGVREVLGSVIVPKIELLAHTGTSSYSRPCIILIKVNPLYC